MAFFFVVIIACMVLFLYRIYHLSEDDLVLLKKNVTVEQIFNCTLTISLFSLLFARIFYVLLHPEPKFLNPLGFLLFPYFPGLSLTGAFVGGVISLFLFCRNRKFPLGRVFDFFALSFLFVIPFGYLGYFLLSGDITTGGVVKAASFTLILFFANIYLYPKSRMLEIKDGTISMLFAIFMSLILLLGSAIDHPGTRSFIRNGENFMLLFILISSTVLLIKQEITGRISLKNGN